MYKRFLNLIMFWNLDVVEGVGGGRRVGKAAADTPLSSSSFSSINWNIYVKLVHRQQGCNRHMSPAAQQEMEMEMEMRWN